ncbi:MAG: ABC-2 family transporter protein [Myxococcota bacterium]
MLRPYLALVSARYRQLLQYRAAAFAGAGTQFFWGFIRIMIFEGFYLSSTAEPPMSFPALVSYVWLGQALLAMLPWNHDQELEGMIRRGDVAYELVRPVDLYGLWFARTLGMRAANTSLRCVPMIFVTGLVLSGTPLERWALGAPESAAAASLFVVAVLAALVLGVAITTLVHISFMWTISGEGMARLVPTLVMISSGMVIPLPLFPSWAQPVLAILPFRGLADTPFRIYSGDLAAGDAAAAILLSLTWAAVLIVAGRALLARGCRRLVIQGG